MENIMLNEKQKSIKLIGKKVIELHHAYILTYWISEFFLVNFVF